MNPLPFPQKILFAGNTRRQILPCALQMVWFRQFHGNERAQNISLVVYISFTILKHRCSCASRHKYRHHAWGGNRRETSGSWVWHCWLLAWKDLRPKEIIAFAILVSWTQKIDSAQQWVLLERTSWPVGCYTATPGSHNREIRFSNFVSLWIPCQNGICEVSTGGISRSNLIRMRWLNTSGTQSTIWFHIFASAEIGKPNSSYFAVICVWI